MRAALLASILLLACLAACGRNGSENPRQPLAVRLVVLPASFEPGGSGEFRLAVDETSDPVRVDVVADGARSLKALYFDLAYDPAQSHPVQARGSGLLAGASGPGADTAQLQLAVFDDPGTVHCGQILPRWQKRAGFSGSGVLASVYLVRGAEREPASVPLDTFSRAQLSYDSVGQNLEWHYASRGDYDQNSEVNISDLTPLGAHFGETSASPPSPFPYSTALSIIDGDGNGEINISDITPIGASFGNFVQSYHIYSSTSATDYPAGPSDPNGPGASLLTTVDFASSASLPTDRRLYVFNVAAPNPLDHYWVRPSDGAAEGIASTMALGSGVANTPPTASFTALPTSGAAPLTVNFDASGSSDPDGPVAQYEWDFDGDSVYEVNNGPMATTSHIFTVDGSYNVHLRVTDNGGLTGGSSTTITVGGAGNLPPTASLLVTPTSGPAPLNVSIDPSASSDPDGTLVLFEYDNDGDGVFDGATATPTLAGWSFTVPGNYLMELRVTDNLGASASAFQMIQVTVPTASWHVTPLITGSNDTGQSNSVASVGGVPAVAWMDETAHVIGYIQAADAQGTSWGAVQTVDADPSVGLPLTDGMNVCLLEIAGNPAIAYYRNDGLYYVRASDASGTIWGTPVATLLDPNGSHASMAIISGNPAISYHDLSTGDLMYLRADSGDGTSWLSPVVDVDSAGSIIGTSSCLAEIAGKPCISYENEDATNVWFAWSTDPSGVAGSWSTVNAFPGANSGNTYTWLAEVDGLPAIVFPWYTAFNMQYIRATDATYLNWTPGIDPASSDPADHGDTPAMAIWNGKPAISFWNNGACGLQFITAGDTDGATWAAPQDVDIFDGSACPGQSSHLAIVAGNPVISYYEETGMDLRVAVYY